MPLGCWERDALVEQCLLRGRPVVFVCWCNIYAGRYNH